MQHDNALSGTPAVADSERRRGGLLIVLSGPSGVGKTTVTDALKAEGWPGYVVVTATTRRPREGEVDGVHYLFRTVQQFQEMVRNGDLLEHAEVHGNYYGVPASPVREQLTRGRDVILTIDPQGAATIRKRTKNAIFIFLAPESVDDLVERVELRGQDTPEQRALRLLNAEREMAELPTYEYVIVNRRDRLAETIAQFKAIVQAEHSRVEPRAAEV